MTISSQVGEHVNTTQERAHSVFARRGYFALVMTLGTAVLCWSLVEIVARPPGMLWVVLGLLTGFSSAAAFRMQGFPLSFSLADTFTIMAALLFGPAAGALLGALDGLTLSSRLRISTPTLERTAFNVTSLALAMWLSAHLFFGVAGRGPLAAEPVPLESILAALTVFATTYFFLNTGLVAGAVAIGRRRMIYHVWREHFFPLWPTHFGGTSIAGLLLWMLAAGLANLSSLILGLTLTVVLLVLLLTGAAQLRRSGEQLAKSRSYAAALRSTADAVLLTDIDRRITFMNSVAERLTGWGHAEAVGRNVNEVLRLEPLAASDSEQARHAEFSGEPSTREYTLVRRDGSTRSIEQAAADIRDGDGEIEGVIRTFRDISLRKTLEAERQVLLRQQQEAREAADAMNRAKDEFLAALSHELRTPMTAILGWVHVLKSGRMDPEGVQRAVASLERGARAQATVVDDLLDISQVARGTLRLDIRQTSLTLILEQAAEIVEPVMQAKRITFSQNVAPDVPFIEGDPNRLLQVFWNLLSNAAKFTPEGGFIQLAAKRDGSGVRVEVADTGCGIEPAFLPFVFDRFSQADASSKRGHRGLGLGLAIVRELVQLHGGTVRVMSEGAGRGSCFIVSLPALIGEHENVAECV